MKNTMQFTQFLSEEKVKEKKKSLQYISDLSLEQFVNSIDNITSFFATEKMDGVALRFGLDESSNFYTSRAGKGSDKKIYNAKDWGTSGASDVFRAAHLVLYSNITHIQSVLFPGDEVDVEILSGKQPNSIIYGKDNFSYLILLGGVNEISTDRYPALFELLSGKTLLVNSSNLYSSDGIEIIEKPASANWKILPVQRIMIGKNSSETDKVLAELVDFMAMKNNVMNMSNADIYGKRSVGQQKSIINDVKDTINSYKSTIVNTLLNEHVDNTKPLLQVKTVKNALESIEGIVFENPDNGLKFKLVDKNMFAKTNRFYYKVRELVKTNARSDNPALPIESRGGIYGVGRLRIASLFNISGFTNTRNQRKILNKHLGNTKSETIDNFVENLKHSDFSALRNKIVAIFKNIDVELKEALKHFMEDKDSYELLLDNDIVVKYNNEITKRTLLVFAETMKQSLDLAHRIEKVKNFNEMIDALYGQKVSKIDG